LQVCPTLGEERRIERGSPKDGKSGERKKGAKGPSSTHRGGGVGPGTKRTQKTAGRVREDGRSTKSHYSKGVQGTQGQRGVDPPKHSKVLLKKKNGREWD